MSLGVGYGILLTSEEIAALDMDDIDRAFKKYLNEHLDKVKKILDGTLPKDDHESILDATWFMQFIDDEKTRGQRKVVFKHGGIDDVARDVFLYPAEECGSKSFFGYMESFHHDDPVCHALLYPLHATGGDNFEILVPANGSDEPLSIANDNVGRFMPNPAAVSQAVLGDFARHVKKVVAEGKPCPFTAREPCDEFVDMALKRNAWIDAVHYQHGLDFVNLFYPAKTLRDIERYIVGWWS